MALRRVVVEGDDILRKKCRPVPEVTDRIKVMMEDMLETMRDSQGVGLAAPQVGLLKRMFVAEPAPGEVYFMINPELYDAEGLQESNEGCLSIPGYIGTVDRPEKIKVRAMDLDGNMKEYQFEGFPAIVMCHEYDHLNGVLFRDRAKAMYELTEEEE